MRIGYWRDICIRATVYGLVAVVLVQGSYALAGPWPRAQGALLLIERSELYTVSRDKGASLFVDDFQQFSTDLYAEYGLTPNVTIGGKVAYLRQQNAFQNSAVPGELTVDNVEGWSERSLYVQTALPPIKDTRVALQLGLVLGTDMQTVSPSDPNADILEQLEEAIELHVLAGRNLVSSGRHFATLDTGIRHYAAGQGRQFRADFTYGWHVTKNIMVLLRNYNTISLSTDIVSPGNYDLSRFDPSLVVKTFLGRVEIGTGRDIHSRNLEQGVSYYIGYWAEY